VSWLIGISFDQVNFGDALYFLSCLLKSRHANLNAQTSMMSTFKNVFLEVLYSETPAHKPYNTSLENSAFKTLSPKFSCTGFA